MCKQRKYSVFQTIQWKQLQTCTFWKTSKISLLFFKAKIIKPQLLYSSACSSHNCIMFLIFFGICAENTQQHQSKHESVYKQSQFYNNERSETVHKIVRDWIYPLQRWSRDPQVQPTSQQANLLIHHTQQAQLQRETPLHNVCHLEPKTLFGHFLLLA